ncbi:MAG: class I SAM-dependent methyltransferase [Lachnospiraceae bacterium]|nr:class I SAM-dependent methyltransferase [Lachnospiraceae bacterium]
MTKGKLEIKSKHEAINRTNENKIETISRTCCLACKSRLPEQALLKFNGMPASAQNIPSADEVKDDAGIPLSLYQCEACGLVQFDCQPVDYYRDVIRSGGFSTTMVELRRSQYRHLIDTYGLEGKKFIEVGCGQGEFLSVLAEFPVQAFGIEHRGSLVQIAQEKGLQVSQGFTEEPETILGKDGPYDVFLSFNFLEHQPEPGVMLDCIRNNLTENGMGLITVPSLEYILQYDGYYELIRDHIAYYSFETLRRLLELHGFEVLEEEMINRDTCSVIVRKHWAGSQVEAPGTHDGSGDQKERKAEQIEKAKSAFVNPVDISALSRSQSMINQELEQLTRTLESQGKTLAIWGASHQGFTLAATTCLGAAAKYIIDSAPFKQGRCAPASHLPIVAPSYFQEHPADLILIAAPGYTQEIAGVIRQQFGSEVEIWTMRSEHLEKLSGSKT